MASVDTIQQTITTVNENPDFIADRVVACRVAALDLVP